MIQKQIRVTIAVKDKQPEVLEFNKYSLTLGTNPDNDIVLQDAVGVPKRAQLSLKDRELILETAKNPQETDTNNADLPAIIESGTSLKLGSNIRLTFEIKDEAPSPLNSPVATPAPQKIDSLSSAESKNEADFVPPSDFNPFTTDTILPKPETKKTSTAKIKTQEVTKPIPIQLSQPDVTRSTSVPGSLPGDAAHTKAIKIRDREYCVGCLELLDPQDNRLEYRAIVQCTKCSALYHSKTWQGLQGCVHCDNKTVIPVQISAPTPLLVLQKPVAIPPKVAGEYRPHTSPKPKIDPKSKANGGEQSKRFESVKQTIKNVRLWLRDSSIMLIFVALISAISVYFERIMVDLPVASRTNLEGILDAILRSPLPQTELFIVGATLNLSLVLVVFPTGLYNRLGFPSFVRRVMRLLAMTVLSLLVGILLLQLQFIAPQNLRLFFLQETVLFQRFGFIAIAAVVLVVLCTPIYRALTRRANKPAYNPQTANFGWRMFSAVRFFAVVLALLALVYLALNTLFVRQWIMNFGQNQNRLIVVQSQHITFGMALAAALALLLYFPPSHKPFTQRLPLLRLIGLVALLILAGSIYARTDQASSLFAAAIAGVVGIIILFPVQRAFS